MNVWDILQGIATVVLTGAILSGIGWLNSGRKTNWHAGLACEIRPNRLIFTILGIISAALATLFFYLAHHGYMTFRYSELYWTVPGGLAFGLMGWTMISYTLFRAYDVSWTGQSLTGPSSHWFPPFGPGRATIAFDEIIEARTDWADAFSLKDSAGRMVKFSYLYKGYPQLIDALAEARPDLFPDDDDWNEPDF